MKDLRFWDEANWQEARRTSEQEDITTVRVVLSRVSYNLFIYSHLAEVVSACRRSRSRNEKQIPHPAKNAGIRDDTWNVGQIEGHLCWQARERLTVRRAGSYIATREKNEISRLAPVLSPRAAGWLY